MPASSARVTVTLAGAGDGGTLLTLRHESLPSESELREGHAVAWNTYLPRLVLRAAGDDPGPGPHADGRSGSRLPDPAPGPGSRLPGPGRSGCRRGRLPTRALSAGDCARMWRSAQKSVHVATLIRFWFGVQGTGLGGRYQRCGRCVADRPTASSGGPSAGSRNRHDVTWVAVLTRIDADIRRGCVRRLGWLQRGSRGFCDEEGDCGEGRAGRGAERARARRGQGRGEGKGAERARARRGQGRGGKARGEDRMGAGRARARGRRAW